MNVKFEKSQNPGATTTLVNLSMGDIGVIVGGNYDGRVVMRTYSGATQLSGEQNSRGTTWLESGCDCHKVRLLEAGEWVKLTVEK